MVVELSTAVIKVLSQGETFKFSFGSQNHSLSLTGLTETEVTISVKSDEQKFTLKVNEEKMIDFEKDGRNDISIILKELNKTANKAKFVITPLYTPEKIALKTDAEDNASSSSETIKNIASKIGDKMGNWLIWAIVIAISVAIILGIAVIIFAKKRYHEERLRHSIKIRY